MFFSKAQDNVGVSQGVSLADYWVKSEWTLTLQYGGIKT